MQLFAYLDPATGSMFIQVIIGSAVAGAVMFRSYLRALIDKIKFAFSQQKIDQS